MAAVVELLCTQAACCPVWGFSGKRGAQSIQFEPWNRSGGRAGWKVILLTKAVLFTKWQSSFTQFRSYQLRLERCPVAIDSFVFTQRVSKFSLQRLLQLPDFWLILFLTYRLFLVLCEKCLIISLWRKTSVFSVFVITSVLIANTSVV